MAKAFRREAALKRARWMGVLPDTPAEAGCKEEPAKARLKSSTYPPDARPKSFTYPPEASIKSFACPPDALPKSFTYPLDARLKSSTYPPDAQPKYFTYPHDRFWIIALPNFEPLSYGCFACCAQA
ncbi:MAG: hypothetical protein NTX50_06895 [Candidatus Sumerlaeota bacterium]|nr:hypothetical protein [Candidatus Sumerlaeota bacterium]